MQGVGHGKWPFSKAHLRARKIWRKKETRKDRSKAKPIRYGKSRPRPRMGPRIGKKTVKKKTTEHFKNWNTPSGYRGSTQSHQVPEPYWTPPMQRRINETETGGRGGQVTITSLIRKRKGLLGWSTCNHIGLVS